MGNNSKSTASSEEAVETTTNEVVAENVEVVAEEVVSNEAASKEAAVVKPKGKTAKVRFLLSPTGTFGLAYSEGETGTFPVAQATELVDSKYAEFVK